MVGDQKRVLLVSANQEHFPEAVFPVGAAYVAHALQTNGFPVRMFDARTDDQDFGSLRREILDFQPHTIGISLRNIDNVTYPHTKSYLPGYALLMKTIRDVTNAKVVLGGSAFSIFPEELLTLLGADAGIVGEGGNAFASLLNEGLNGIQRSAQACGDGFGYPRNLDGIFPSLKNYTTLGIQTKRGCCHRCIYCTYPSLEGSVVRVRHPESVAEEIDYLHKKFRIGNFFIVDSAFNADEEHMEQTLKAIIAKNLHIRFSCYCQPKTRDVSLFRLLKEAGCIAVDFGTDSGSDVMLHALRKSFSSDEVRRVSAACAEAGIDVCHSLILGGPGETSKTVQETVRLMDEVSPKAVVAMTGVRVYPGTEMEKVARDEGLVKPGESLLEPRFYFSAIGPERLVKEVHETASERKNWFLPGKRDWSAAIGPRLIRVLTRNGPLWKRPRL